MADSGDTGVDQTARLEAALARIAHARPTARAPTTAADRQELAARLDSLIGELRAVLGRDSAD